VNTATDLVLSFSLNCACDRLRTKMHLTFLHLFRCTREGMARHILIKYYLSFEVPCGVNISLLRCLLVIKIVVF
jgi:hypothetical protein